MSHILPGQIATQSMVGSDKAGNSVRVKVEPNFQCIKSGGRNRSALKETQRIPAGGTSTSIFLLERRSPLDSAWANAIKSTKKEKSINLKPFCQFLTLLTSLTPPSLGPWQRHLFIPWDGETVDKEGKSLRQDVIVVDAERQDIERFLRNDMALSHLPRPFLYHDEDGKHGSRISYSDIQMVGEIKEGIAPESNQGLYNDAIRILDYMCTISRYQPQHAAHIGFLAYRNGFFIIDFYPDCAVFSELFGWEDKDLAWNALKNAISDMGDRPFTTELFASLGSKNRHDKSHLQFCLSERFWRCEEVYQLFDLYRHGWGSNTYAGVGIRSGIKKQTNSADWKVIKHCWHDFERHFNELKIMKYIYRSSRERLCTAGIVTVDFIESRELDIGISPLRMVGKRHVERRSVLLVMKTLGKALASCSSVLQFLKAMYDLVEVHRMLVEEHQVLHRDISWDKVLIDPIHVDNDSWHDDLSGRPFIDEILGVDEGARKVHATLSGFDCACILDPRDEKRHDSPTGTPMFMARPLCSMPDGLKKLNPDLTSACELVFPQDATGVDQRQDEVSRFSTIVRQNQRYFYVQQRNQPETYLVHAPMHDAESVFWLIVLFFLRAYPKGYDHKSDESDERYRRARRTKIFESLATNTIGMGQDVRQIPVRASLPPQLHQFAEMIDELDDYFLRSWHLLDVYDDEPCVRFHAHNALQAVLLKAIKKVQTDGDIELRPMPLGVDDKVIPSMPEPKSYISNTAQRSVPKGNARKSQRKSREAMSNVLPDNGTNSEWESIMFAVESNERSKLWFMGDDDYKDYALVEALPRASWR